MLGKPAIRVLTASASLACVMLAGCGRSAGGGDKANKTAKTLVTTTAPGTRQVGSVVWATYRDVETLDPISVFDAPDNTALTLMCESLLRMQPDGRIGAGLASLTRSDPRTLVFDVNPKATFWDGRPVTAQDVVYSLGRQMSPKLGGYFGSAFSRVASVTATGPKQVTVKLKQADYWLDGELASTPGTIIEQHYAQKAGKNYGTPGGGVMCTGAYEFKSWQGASGVVAVPNPHYWDPSVKPLVKQVTVKGVASDAALASGLATGAITGTYPVGVTTLAQIQRSSAVTVYQGAGHFTDGLVISNLKGPLGNVKVRQALSLAVNRQGYIDATYPNAATLPQWFSNAGTFGYAKSTFEAALRQAPTMRRDLAEAKKLMNESGQKGKAIVIGMTSETAQAANEAAAYQAAGAAIGLNVRFKAVSANDFINFFTDPSARKGVDAFPTVNYGDYSAPEALLQTFLLPDGSQNFSGFNDPKITGWLEQARATADPVARAKLIIQVEQRVDELLPWIPTCEPTNVLVLNKKLTGAVASFAYMFAPWANQLGGR